MLPQTATILVTDLVGSTEVRARLGEEAAERLRRVHDRLLRHAVESHGGTVVKGLGDGILARFAGAAEAVAAAVAIQQAAHDHTRRQPDAPLVLRVGLSAGDVTVDDDGDHFGLPVIEAARLCAAADGGQILVTALVPMLARGRGGHRFVSVGDLELKGLPDPVATVEVMWEPAGVGGSQLPFPPLLRTGGTLAFAGRTAHLELLLAAWKQACAGERRSVLIGGEPGVGKTRLAAEVAWRAHQEGATVLYGRCEEGLGVPYEPIVEALTRFCDEIPAEALRSRLGRFPGEFMRLVPDLGLRLPGLDPPLRSDPETEQYRLFEAVTSWLVTAGEEAGVFLVIDDLHWAAPPTLHLLAHVLRGDGPARLLIVGTFRDTEVDASHPLFGVLAELRRLPMVDRLSLGGLSVDELAELLEAMPRAHAGRTLAAALYEGTEGNPFFVGELLRSVGESDVPVETMPVPEGVREVVMSRVARLSSSARELLGVASVLGRDVELRLLAGVAGTDEDAAVDALDEALVARLVEETGVGVYRFIHAIVRSALYDSLSATRKARLHLRAADVLDAAGRPDAAHLAHHLVAAGPLSEATRSAGALLAAGDRALAALADAEGLAWYEQGLALAGEESPAALRIDLAIGLGEARRRVGDPNWRETLLDAARLAACEADTARLVRAVVTNSRGFASVIGHVDDERIELIETALERVGPEASAERAELLSLLAAELAFGADHQRRLRVADEAKALAQRLGDRTLQARVGVRRLTACLTPDRIGDLAVEAGEVVTLADATGDPLMRSLARVSWAGALEMVGNLAGVRRQTVEAVQITDEAGQPALRAVAHMFHAAALDAVGEHAESERFSQAGVDLGQQGGMPDALMWYSAQMCLRGMFEGQSDAAAMVAAQALTEFPRMVVWAGTQALALGLSGRGEEVAALVAGLEDPLVDMFWLCAHFEFAAAMGFGWADRELARLIYERLLPYRSFHASYLIGYLGPVEMGLAVASRVLGDLETGLAHHQAAATAIEECGAARARAFNDYQWAVTLLTRDAPGDRTRARRLLEETVAYSQDRGYATLESKAADLLATRFADAG